MTAYRTVPLGEMIQVTAWSRGDEILDTQYGVIPVWLWLNKEVERIGQGTGRRAEIRTRLGKDSWSLFVDNVVSPSKVESRGLR